MEREIVKLHEKKKRRVVLKSGRVYTCTIFFISEPNAQGNALVQARDKNGNFITFSTDDVEAIETIMGGEE